MPGWVEPFKQVRRYLELVRFPHTIFAMPFALLSMVVAAEGWPGVRVFSLILVCLVTARTAAMTFNRIADRDLDALNPRTKNRHLPTGTVKLSEASAILSISAVLFVAATYALNLLAFYLSPVVLLVVCGYSYTKRFTWASHLILGLALGMAPIGAWIAVQSRLDALPLILGMGVLFWVAGFDIIYALADEEFDRKVGLYSLVVRLGRLKALWVSRLLHAGAILFIALFGWMAMLGALFWTGWWVFSLALAYEQSIIRPDDLSRVNVAFFNVNGTISILLFLFGAADVIWS